MSNINPIKFGINTNQYLRNEEKEDLSKSTQNNKKSAEAESKQMESTDVLGFMAIQNNDIIPVKATRTYDVSKYVSQEQAERIGNFIGNFEADFDALFEATQNEFGDISDNAASEIALARLDSEYAKD